MTSTAIRYTQQTPDIVAIVVSHRNTIKYCFMSNEFEEIKGLNWIKKNSLLPKNTATYHFNQTEVNVKNAEFLEDYTSFNVWFGNDKPFELYEEVKGLGTYDRTLTVLSANKVLDQEEIDEEDDLEKSWTPKFRK